MPCLRLRAKAPHLVTTTLLIFLLSTLVLLSLTSLDRVPSQLISLLSIPHPSSSPPPSSSPSPPPAQHCTLQTAMIRRDWNALDTNERRAYIHAVQCLQRAPSTLPAGEVPASRSLYDDFVAVHVNNTPLTHKSAIFLPWHRHFNLLFERALHDVCAYPPRQGVPYWNWPETERDDASGLFSPWTSEEPSKRAPPEDASEAEATMALETPPPEYYCLRTGAFANTSVTMGPIDVDGSINASALATWGTPRPHCLARNPTFATITAHLNPERVARALAAPSIDAFSLAVAGSSRQFALHGWAHRAIGGQMADSFCASADPLFYLHHAMVDRLWSRWQEGAPGRRFAHCCEDREAMFRFPEVGAANETVMSFGVLGRDVRVEEVADPMAGGELGYCYRYE